jgi:hypothetical protein
LTLGGLWRGVVRTFRERWKELLLASAIVFVPLGLLDTVDEALRETDFEEITDLASVALIAEGLLHAAGTTIGDAFFSGLVGAIVLANRGGHAHGIGWVLRNLPWVALIVTDLAFTLLVAVGFVALIVPGFVAIAWFALAAPLVKIERLRPVAAFRRSRRLVRGRFWRVFGVVVPVWVGTSVLEGASEEAFRSDIFLVEWAAAAGTGMAVGALYAVPVVVLAYDLHDRGELTLPSALARLRGRRLARGRDR